MNFSDYFTANNCTQKINAIIHDDNLVEYGENIYEHVWAEVEANDQEIYIWLNNDAREVYEKMNGQEQSEVEQLFHDWLKDRYDYVPG